MNDIVQITQQPNRCEQLATVISRTLGAMRTCHERGNNVWKGRHMETLIWIADNCLPSGSGIDNGTQIMFDWQDRYGAFKLKTAFHHMNDQGYYDGWTDHIITVRPDLIHGLDLHISGHNKAGIKDYLAEVYLTALEKQVALYYDEDEEFNKVRSVDESR